RLWHWLSVDPNPGTSDEPAATGWLENALSTGWSFIDQYIVHYTPEQRDKAISAIRSGVTRPDVLAGVAAGVVLIVGIRRLRRRARTPLAAPPGEATRWFGQLLAVLAAHGFVPQPGQTAREFAAAVAEALRERPPAAGLAGVPVEWA